MASVSGTKRLSDNNDVGPTHTTKIQRVEHHSNHGLPPPHHAGSSPHQRLPTANNDFSGSVKRKLADSKRTGQACDRCKVSAPPSPSFPSSSSTLPGILACTVQCGAVQSAECLCWAGLGCMLPIALHARATAKDSAGTDRAILCCTRRTHAEVSFAPQGAGPPQRLCRATATATAIATATATATTS